MPVSTLIAKRMMLPSMGISLLQLLAGPDVAECQEEKQDRVSDEKQIEHRIHPFAPCFAAEHPGSDARAARRLFKHISRTLARPGRPVRFRPDTEGKPCHATSSDLVSDVRTGCSGTIMAQVS
jgi:hypothetical protein